MTLGPCLYFDSIGRDAQLMVKGNAMYRHGWEMWRTWAKGRVILAKLFFTMLYCKSIFTAHAFEIAWAATRDFWKCGIGADHCYGDMQVCPQELWPGTVLIWYTYSPKGEQFRVRFLRWQPCSKGVRKNGANFFHCSSHSCSFGKSRGIHPTKGAT